MSKMHETYDVGYHCSFASGKQSAYNFSFDVHTFLSLHKPPEPWPEWTLLDYHRCPNCKLDVTQNIHCPAAIHLSQIVADFHDLEASAPLEVKVVTKNRTVSLTSSSQSVLSSLMGMVLATSGCPVAAPFRPLARFHLPVSSDDETMYRVISMYLMSRFVVRRKGKTSGLELNGLLKIYRDMEQLNKALSNRVASCCKKDAVPSGLKRLNIYAHNMPLAMEEYLDRLNPLFATYLTESTVV